MIYAIVGIIVCILIMAMFYGVGKFVARTWAADDDDMWVIEYIMLGLMAVVCLVLFILAFLVLAKLVFIPLGAWIITLIL